MKSFIHPLGVILSILLIFEMIPPTSLYATSSNVSTDHNNEIVLDENPPYESIPLPEPEITSILADMMIDTNLSSASEKIKVKLPKNSLNQSGVLEIVEYPTINSSGTKILNLFELNAYSEDKKTKFEKFPNYVEITIQHTDAELSGLDLDSLRLYYLDEKSLCWMPVDDSKYDRKTKTLTAKTSHFSYFGEQANTLESGPGRVTAFQVGLFTGSAVFNYPLELPPGPGGFQPTLVLSYDSSSIDEMKDKRAVASWVGMGWSLSLGKISKDLSSGQYWLTLNGNSYKLVTVDGVDFTTCPEENLKITRDGNTWEVLDTRGIYYRFGGSVTSEQYLAESEGGYYQWDLSLMRDTNNNECNISYTQEIRGISTDTWVRNAVIDEITYGQVIIKFNSSWDITDATDGNLRKDNPKSTALNPAPKIMETRKLDSIEIKVGTTLIRKYAFTYSTTNSSERTHYGGIYYAGYHTLTSFKQYGADGTSSLPVMTFTYSEFYSYNVERETDEITYDGNPGNPASINHPYLKQINNGYGATISIELTKKTGPMLQPTDFWSRIVVSKLTIVSSNTQTYTYTYSGYPQYFGAGWDQEFRGFAQVKEKDAMNNYIIHSYYTTGIISGIDTEKLSGHEYLSQWYDSNNILVKEQNFNWSIEEDTNTLSNIIFWSSEGSGDGFVGNCRGIVASDGEFIYITDFGSNLNYTNGIWQNYDQIQKLNKDSNFIQKWGSSAGNGQLCYPEGVCFLGYLYVTDKDNNRIEYFSKDGLYLGSFGSRGTELGQFQKPSGICAGGGYIYVVDQGNHRIQKFNGTGTYISSWGIYGTGNGQFDSPTGITFISNGTTDEIYITDSGNNRIQVFDTNGNYLRQWGISGTGNGEFNNPTGITGGYNKIFVCDTNNNRIQKFDYNGNFISTWGSYGSGLGQFNLPTYAYFAYIGIGNYELYVTDSGNNRIQIYADSGEFKTQFGLFGDESGNFNHPSGVCRFSAVIAGETFYYLAVVDTNNNRIQKFSLDDSEWGYIAEIDGSGSGQGLLSLPEGVVIDSDFNIYVLDSGNSRVQKFAWDGSFICEWGSQGTGNGQFDCPSDIAISTSNNCIWVLDKNNNRVQKFDLNGNYISQYGTQGSANGQFSNPDGICYWSSYLYIADTGNNRIQVFDLNGTFIRTWGTQGTADGEFNSPTDIAYCTGKFYVADSGNNRIQSFGLNGTYLGQFGSFGTGEGQFNNPTDISTDPFIYPDTFYVSDCGNNRIQQFDDTDAFVAEWGMQGSGCNQFDSPKGLYFKDDHLFIADLNNNKIKIYYKYPAHLSTFGIFVGNGNLNSPWGICIDVAGNIYVVDKDNNRIQKFDTDGNFVLKFGSYGTENGQFNHPTGVAVDVTGNIYILDCGNNRVEKFDSSGLFITSWGTYGTGNGQFDSPNDICIDDYGNIYITDTNNHRIQKFSSNGTFITCWGTQGSGDGQFGLPSSICVDSEYIYVSEEEGNRIQKFDLSGNFIAKWVIQAKITDISICDDGLFIVDSTNHQIIQITYNFRVQLDQLQETLGNKTSQTRYIYDDYGNISIQYNDGDISTNIDDSTVFKTYNYNLNNNITSLLAYERIYAGISIDDGGINLRAETRYYYDGNNTSLYTAPDKGNLTRLERKTDSLNSISTYFTYDIYGNKLTEEDPNGNTTVWTFETTYNIYPQTKTLPITGLVESYSYESGTKNLTSFTDVNGQVTNYYYDTFKRQTKVVKPGDTTQYPSIEYLYNSWGNTNSQNNQIKIKVTNTDYLWTKQYFDGLGRITQVQSRGETGYIVVNQTNKYDVCGYLEKQYVTQNIQTVNTSYQYPQTNWKYTSFTYDNFGRPLLQTNYDGTTISYDYSVPWQNTITNERSFKKSYLYDAYSRLTQVIEYDESDAVYATTEYTYDIIGNLTQVRDNSNNLISMNYDWLSRKISMIDPDMGGWSYGYDNNSNLTSQTDALNHTISYTYDALNRITCKAYPAGLGMTDVTYTYDDTTGGNYGKGLRTGMTDASGATTWIYDTRGRMIEEIRTIDLVNYTTSFSYDGADRINTITYPTGEVVTQTYNKRGLAYTLSGSIAGNLVTNTLYTQLGMYKQIDFGNTLRTTFGYYGLSGSYDTTGGYYGKLWEIKTLPQSGGTALQDTRYTWDAAGNVSTRQDVITTETEAFTYDFLDRLTAVSGPYTASYSYNQIGNITAMNGLSYTYGIQPHAVTQIGTTDYAYDANGNMTTRGAQTIVWDLENMPVSITEGGNTTTFVYDGDGNRIKQMTSTDTILYVNKYYEKNLTTAEVITRYYLGDTMVAERRGITLSYAHQDSLNSTSLVTSSTGTSLGSTKYYPYGITRSGSVPTDEKFTGQKLDNTGLYYYNARYYDPVIGRFLSADTLIQDIHNPQCLNRYSYVLNNPLKYIDPNGHRMVIPGNPPQNGIPFPGPEGPGGSDDNGSSDDSDGSDSNDDSFFEIDGDNTAPPRMNASDAIWGTVELSSGIMMALTGGIIFLAIFIPGGALVAPEFGLGFWTIGGLLISDGIEKLFHIKNFYIPGLIGP